MKRVLKHRALNLGSRERLAHAFNELRDALQDVLDNVIAKDVMIKRLTLELAEAVADNDTIVTIEYPARAES